LALGDLRNAFSRRRRLSAELNVVVDEIGGMADLVGLCQGGWMALVYAARFPAKVRKLVLAGASIDIAAVVRPVAAC
jgi:pimeloyl-ACP methyl ester carboxylesterase